jgi:hypothetical protein
MMLVAHMDALSRHLAKEKRTMTLYQIGLVVQFVKDCGKEVTTELVLEVCNIIDPSVTFEHVERAIALKKSQDHTGWVF